MGGVLVGDESGHPILTRILHNVCSYLRIGVLRYFGHHKDLIIGSTIQYEKHKSE